MLDLLYSHRQGHFECHAGSDLVLATNGQVLIGDGATRRCYLEWSAVEEMFSALLSGADATDVEVAGRGYGRLEVYAGQRLIAEDAGFSLSPLPAAFYGGVALLDAAGEEKAVLRGGDWWLPGERLGDLTITAVGVSVEQPDVAKPGTRSRVSNLAERLLAV